ncbi:MAG: OPT family oligopeptide transporter [Proteobacteria bacterium]|nr:OPT family oligopeptide transporter [Pseudomonadota bacterium]MCP4917744.1 OPT family oligopeptide transporter [Pseudomonadota bacterium]
MADQPLVQKTTDEKDAERLYEPVAGESGFSLRAVLVGGSLGSVVAAMNIYLGLRIGWSFGGSLIAAILGFAIFTMLTKSGILKKKFGVLEANITQTAGSAAGSMTSAAGLLAPIPAMIMLGHTFEWWELLIWSFAVAYLGVFFAVPLRRQMVLVEKLRFPTGTATAQTIMAMFSSGDDALAKAKHLMGWGALAFVFTLSTQIFYSGLEMPPIESIGLSIFTAWTFSFLISPMMTGAGILIGPRVGTSLLLGAILGWIVIGGYAVDMGWAGGPVFDEEAGQWGYGTIMSYSEGVRGWILWPGVAIMVADSLTSLGLSWRTILNTFMPKNKDNAEIVDLAPDSIPNAWWMGGLGVASCLTIGATWFLFDIPPHFSIIAIVLSAVLAMIAVRSTGETDINPIGGMGKVTQLVFGGLAPGLVATNLMSAAITGSGASQAGDMMQDLKTGYMLGASPRNQFKAQLIGIAFGIVSCVPIFLLFDAAYDIGGEELPAPAAHAWKAVAELLANGLDALPANAEFAVLGGICLGIAMPVLRKSLPKKYQDYVPSTLAMGIAMIVPAYYSVSMFLGAMILVAWKKLSPKTCLALSFAVASGLVAGEGLAGIPKAILVLLGVEPIFG